MNGIWVKRAFIVILLLTNNARFFSQTPETPKKDELEITKAEKLAFKDFLKTKIRESLN